MAGYPLVHGILSEARLLLKQCIGKNVLMVSWCGLISSGMLLIISQLASRSLVGWARRWLAEFFNNIIKVAQQAKTVTISPSEWSWSAQSFWSFWMMRISFTVTKITALAVHHGVRRALVAHAEL